MKLLASIFIGIFLAPLVLVILLLYFFLFAFPISLLMVLASLILLPAYFITEFLSWEESARLDRWISSLLTTTHKLLMYGN